MTEEEQYIESWRLVSTQRDNIEQYKYSKNNIDVWGKYIDSARGQADTGMYIDYLNVSNIHGYTTIPVKYSTPKEIAKEINELVDDEFNSFITILEEKLKAYKEYL